MSRLWMINGSMCCNNAGATCYPLCHSRLCRLTGALLAPVSFLSWAELSVILVNTRALLSNTPASFLWVPHKAIQICTCLACLPVSG